MLKDSHFNLDDYIRKVPDFPRKGILYYDISSILISPEAFLFCIDSMVNAYKNKNFHAVAAIEARGFLFAAPFAIRMGLPLILVRKKGKLPCVVSSKEYDLEYGKGVIEIHCSDIPKGKNVLLVDDLIATGGTLDAARFLLVNGGAAVLDIFGVIGLPFLNYKKLLDPTPVLTLINYDM